MKNVKTTLRGSNEKLPGEFITEGEVIKMIN